MFDFLTQTYYGNTVAAWAIAFAIMALSFAIARLGYWIVSRAIKRLTQNLETNIGELLLDLVEQPVVAAIFLAGIQLAFQTLTLPEEIDAFIENTLNFILTILIAWLIIRLYDAFHQTVLLRRASKADTAVDDQILPLIRTSIRFVVFSLAIVVGLNNAGYDVGAILAGLGIGGLAFALAAQHTVGNLIAGMSLYFDKHIKVGDRVQLRGVKGNMIDGEVLEISLRTTKIKTRYEGRIVAMPNTIVANQDVVNVDSEDGRQMFAVYKLDPTTCHEKVELAMQMLKDIAREHENTKDIAVTGLINISEISKDVMLLYWVKPDASNLKTRTSINLEILRRMEAHDIHFTDRTYYHYQNEVGL